MAFQLSKGAIVKEIVKAGKDPVYFIDNYCMISHPMKGQIPFKMFDFQKELVHEFLDYRFNVVLKARQLGISTVASAYVLWLMLFHRNKNVLVIATKQGTAANLIKKVKPMYFNLPIWMQQVSEVVTDNRAEFSLANGSEIKASSTSSDAGRSEALSLLVIDEAAHVDGLEELWIGLYSTLSTGGGCLALSTPNGVSNWFHEVCTKAESGENDFNLTILPWDVHPERDADWYQKETRNMSPRQIAQELNCDFSQSGETVFDIDDIQRIKEEAKEPIRKAGFDRNIWVWEEYIPGKQYALAADVARGDGADYSTFLIMRIDTGEIVAEYKGKVAPDHYSEIIYSFGLEYGQAMVVVENNSIGWGVLEKLIKRNYPNLFYSKKGSHQFIENHAEQQSKSATPGFSTSAKTRPLIIAKLEEYIRNKQVKNLSSRFASEMDSFIWKNGKPQAASKSNNDDLIMACAILCWVKDTVFASYHISSDYTKSILSCMVRNPTTINTTIPGMQGFKGVKRANNIRKQIEYSWLIKG